MTLDTPRRVWFHRGLAPLSGGQVKHSHYFRHVRCIPGFAPVITFSRVAPSEFHAGERRKLWPVAEEETAEGWQPEAGDVLFLAGTDWRYAHECGLLTSENPRINLIQHVKHAHEGSDLHSYLGERAVRICVSHEVAGAITDTGRARARC